MRLRVCSRLSLLIGSLKAGNLPGRKSGLFMFGLLICKKFAGGKVVEYRLYDIAKVIRSKNSGPFQITLDILFDDPRVYEKVKDSGIITGKTVAGLYNMEPERILDIVFFDAALGIKITYDRKISSGTCGERDVYGAQQHMPLAELRFSL